MLCGGGKLAHSGAGINHKDMKGQVGRRGWLTAFLMTGKARCKDVRRHQLRKSSLGTAGLQDGRPGRFAARDPRGFCADPASPLLQGAGRFPPSLWTAGRRGPAGRAPVCGEESAEQRGFQTQQLVPATRL